MHYYTPHFSVIIAHLQACMCLIYATESLHGNEAIRNSSDIMIQQHKLHSAKFKQDPVHDDCTLYDSLNTIIAIH